MVMGPVVAISTPLILSVGIAYPSLHLPSRQLGDQAIWRLGNWANRKSAVSRP
jgi:hypothetical protein